MVPGQRLTQVLPLLLGRLPEDALECQAQVAEEDEGRRQGGAPVVLHDEVVALELPEGVGVSLHHLERVAGNTGDLSPPAAPGTWPGHCAGAVWASSHHRGLHSHVSEAHGREGPPTGIFHCPLPSG